MTIHGRDKVIASIRKQVAWCDTLGSPFTAGLLRLLTEDIESGGPAARLVAGWPGDPVADALPLRLAGALHALVLGGTEPSLAACYPPHPNARLPAVLRDVVARQVAFIADFLRSPPQTNEVGRSGVLLGGFLEVAQATGLPLRVLEIGASAGLNLAWDHYAYRIGLGSWGDPSSPVTLAPAWAGPLPPLTAPLSVAERAACDVAPIDLEDAPQRLHLKAYVWPDQRERLARLDSAIAVARRIGMRVERADAAVWLRERLAVPAPGLATVLDHSIMWQYMPELTRANLRATIDEAGARATPGAPFAWLRLEPPRPEAQPELTLTLWPGGAERCLATAHPHGTSVRWLGG